MLGLKPASKAVLKRAIAQEKVFPVSVSCLREGKNFRNKIFPGSGSPSRRADPNRSPKSEVRRPRQGHVSLSKSIGTFCIQFRTSDIGPRTSILPDYPSDPKQNTFSSQAKDPRTVPLKYDVGNFHSLLVLKPAWKTMQKVNSPACSYPPRIWPGVRL